MPVVTAADLPDVRAEIPKGFCESAIIRCLKATFGPSKSSGKPMITAEWELLGVRDPKNPDKLLKSVRRNGVDYVLAGVSVASTYHTLTPEALKYYKPLWAKFTGLPETEFSINTDNPDLSYFNKLVMSAVIEAKTQVKTRELSDEEKAVGVTDNTVKGEDGKPISFTQAGVVSSNGYQFNKRFTGEVEPF